MIELLEIDCNEYMKGCKDNQFDLVIVDPPYGIDAPNMSMGGNKNKNKSNTSDSVANRLKKARFSKGAGVLKNRMLNTARLDWDIKPTQEYFDELFRVSKNQIIMGGNYFNLPPTRGIICWDKVQPWDNFSQWEMLWSSFNIPARLFRYSNKGGHNQETKTHPTQKPIKLYEWLLSNYAKEGDRILDTHLGSGSIAIACDKMGFSLVRCENDEIYYNDAVKRYEEYKFQKENQNSDKCYVQDLVLFNKEAI